MSSTAMDSAVPCYRDSSLVDALRALASSEKSRAGHAQQSFNYKGAIKWDSWG
jgi:hypothetical protein